jgi:hypothetical protein
MSSTSNPSGSAAKRPARVGSEELEKVKRGEWTVEQYIDDRVERAIVAMPLRLTETQRESVRETLRFQVATDPVLAEYVRLSTVPNSAATGR